MIRAVIVGVLAVGLAGCAAETATPCGRMCRELVTNCGYAAYPTFDSCLQGCGYNEAEGADIDGMETCVDEAQCDTFAIVECEHAYNE